MYLWTGLILFPSGKEILTGAFIFFLQEEELAFFFCLKGAFCFVLHKQHLLITAFCSCFYFPCAQPERLEEDCLPRGGQGC